MRVMVSNHTSMTAGYLAGRYPGRVGHLYSPGFERGPWGYMPYALDNGAFGAWVRGVAFDVAAWRRLLRWAQLATPTPLWALVPDVVADKAGTLRAWDLYAEEVVAAGFRPAFAAQDGMVPEDVPVGAAIVFLGGTMEWKLDVLARWGEAFPGRLHVGRINTFDLLTRCWRAGAVSVDGTGWFHRAQAADLERFLSQTAERWAREMAEAARG